MNKSALDFVKIPLFLFFFIKISIATTPFKNILSGHAGFGFNSLYYGAHFLMYVSEMHAWGPEISFFSTKEENYTAVCIVLEACLFKRWIDQMGLSGYIGNKAAKPFGIRLSTGVELPLTKKISIPITIRTDIIFDEKIIFLSNLSGGIRFNFP